MGAEQTPGSEETSKSPEATSADAAQSKSVPSRGPGRGWTERTIQPVAYRRSTLKDEHGNEKILFIFNLPPGVTKPPQEIIDVLRDHKFWKDGKPYGLADDAKSNAESYPTRLTFGANRKYPKAWVLPNDKLGRTVADSIDQALDRVARRLESNSPTQG